MQVGLIWVVIAFMFGFFLSTLLTMGGDGYGDD